MTTQQKIEAIQDKIGYKILSIGCKIKHKIHGDGIYIQTSGDRNIGYDCFFFGVSINRGYGEFIQDLENIEIIGHPVSLARVLSALDYKYKLIPLHNNGEYSYYIDTGAENSIKRELLNKGGSDAMLDSQSEETIEALYNIICK